MVDALKTRQISVEREGQGDLFFLEANKMGALTAPVSCLFLNGTLGSSKPNPRRVLAQTITAGPKIPSVTQRRQLLLVLPISLAAQFSYCRSALADFDPVTPAERDASAAVSRRVTEAVDLLERGRELQAQGSFNRALECFTQVVEKYKDLAFSEYARVGRAITLYEVGDRDEAIAEMEDVSISLKGYPEVHAALAAALYVDKHAPLLAENQFTIATLLDPHYTDLSYVRETKHWPPSLKTSHVPKTSSTCK